MADTLGAPIAYFFADVPAEGEQISAQDKVRREGLERPETIDLIRLYYAISDPAVRHQFFELVKAVARPLEQGK